MPLLWEGLINKYRNAIIITSDLTKTATETSFTLEYITHALWSVFFS